MRKNLLINAFGIGGGQGILLLATPLLARIYSPEQFGEYAVVLAIAGIFATVASLRFDIAIPSLSASELRPIFHIALTLVLVLSPAVVAAGLLIASSIKVLALPLDDILIWIVLLVIAMGVTNVCQACFVREGDFWKVSIIKICQPVIFCVLAMIDILGLNAALLISWALGSLIALWCMRDRLSLFNFGLSWSAAVKNQKYVTLSSPMALLDTASLSLPLLYIAFAFGEDSAGEFSQVQRLLAAPLILFGVAASQVFYKQAGDLYRRDEPTKPLIIKLVFGLGIIGIFLVIFDWLYGEIFLNWMLGDAWNVDSTFVILAVAPMIIRMTVSPVSSVFLITKRLDILSMWQGAYFIVSLLAIFYAIGRLNLEGYMLLVLFTEAALYLVYLILGIRVACSERMLHDCKIAEK